MRTPPASSLTRSRVASDRTGNANEEAVVALYAPQQLRLMRRDHVFDPHMKLPTVHEWNFSIPKRAAGVL